MRFLRSLSREQIAFALVVTIAPLLLCGYIFGFDIPLASAKFWTNPKNDMIAMTAAYEAYIRQPWTFPVTMVSGLVREPISIVFTDSVPWLSILLKASGVGAFFNPLGVFLMLSYVAQSWSMVALLRALGATDRIALAVGALLALMYPSWMARQFGHIALSGHFLILLGLALSVASARQGLTPRRIVAFAGLTALATGIHAYHLVSIGACFGAALLAELFQRRPGAWKRVPVAAVAVLAAAIFSGWFLGYDQGVSRTGGAGAIGFYSMNFLGPVWPQASRLFGQYWNGSWFYGTMDPNGGQAFEGFQFLGCGALFLIGAMLVWAVRERIVGHRPEPGFWARWTPLILAMTGLFLWAVGWVVYVGPLKVAEIPKPSGKIADVISTFRGHGRFFWAPGYLLLALGVLATTRMPRRIGLGVLALGLAVQAYDTTPMRQGVKTIFATPDGLDVPLGLLDNPAIRNRPWMFRPTYFCSPSPPDLRVISQMALIAERTGGTTNTFGTARSNDAPCELVPQDMTMNAAPGDRRLTIVMSNSQWEGGFLQPIAQRDDCYRFKRGAMCGRDLENVAGLTPVARGEFAAAREPLLSIRLDKLPKSPALTSGWADLDPGGQGLWTTARQVMFELDAPKEIKPGGFFVDVVAIGFSEQPLRPQRVTLYVEGRKLESQEVDPGAFYPYRFKVPADAVKPGQTARFMFELPDARVSKIDPRMLGIGVQEIRIVQ